jgi:hypothetical protein
MPNSKLSVVQTLATKTAQQPSPETACPTCGVPQVGAGIVQEVGLWR